ncbi:hypothetical protein CC80DRAFT_161069 [Byssothecium circinans]|uniref:Uncharacterized protein n=1 Tax=Byssothecium circinans TaxID=147558 RepID=A0A6A5UCL0_9PLEO|nr:hypothetical protein CC80DRAFT_161069 [Byssothecium circinans]
MQHLPVQRRPHAQLFCSPAHSLAMRQRARFGTNVSTQTDGIFRLDGFCTENALPKPCRKKEIHDLLCALWATMNEMLLDISEDRWLDGEEPNLHQSTSRLTTAGIRCQKLKREEWPKTPVSYYYCLPREKRPVHMPPIETPVESKESFSF